jgi:hypothetical protein
MKGKISTHERERRARQSAQSRAEQQAYDMRGFCRCYGIGRTLAYDEIKSGRLRVKKVGRRTLVARDDAEDWLANLPHAGGGGAR